MDKQLEEIFARLEAAAEILGETGYFRRSEDVTWCIEKLRERLAPKNA